MKSPVALAVALLLSSLPISAERQSPAKPRSTGIPECDKYAAMVTACLPKMCEDERMLKEMELGFALEMIPKQVELKGRHAAAQSCARDISEAIQSDEYGCYASKTTGTSASKSIQLDKIRPSATGVTLTFSGKGPESGEQVRVIIARSISEQPVAVYPMAGWTGQLVLDTASASPGTVGAPAQPIQLEPGTTYCFAVESAIGNRTDFYRKGIFTTLPKR
jgi:hypothetical protein